MRTYGDWQRVLTATQSGRIWWANFQFDLRRRNITTLTEADFREGVERLLAAPAGTPHPMVTIDLTVSSEPAKFDLKCTRTPTTPEPYSRVLDAEDFARFNVLWSELGLERDERTGEKVWDWLGTIIDLTHYTGMIKTRREFFWCSPTRSIKRIQASSKSGREATEIRNQLGLYHVGEGQRLLRVDLPGYILARKMICAPTTLDAGNNVVFVPSDDARGIGWTLNLSTLARGIEEIVVESLPLNADFVVTKIGIVSETPPSINWHQVEADAVAR